jgi:hypothetical protein
MRLLVAGLILSAVFVLGIAAFETRVLLPEPSNGPAHGIVWAGQTFPTRAAFARWLRSQGTSYRAWARRHPVQAGLGSTRQPEAGAHRNEKARAGDQKHSRWSPGVLAGIAALLGALAVCVALVRRRWPGSGAAVAHLIEVIGLASAAAIEAGARTTRRWAAPAARRTAALAAAATSSARRALSASTSYLVEVVAPKSAAAGVAGARTTRRWAVLKARSSADRAAATFRARHGFRGSPAHRLDVVALRGATAAKAGARTTRRWAALTAHRSTVLTTVPTFSARRRRFDLVCYVTTAVLAAGIGVVVAALLNGG